MGELKLGKHTIQAYFKMLEDSKEKIEFHNGTILSMAGGTLNHSAIGLNTNSAINQALNNSDNCRPFNSDASVYIESTNSFVFPDGVVVCGDVETYKESNTALTNPILIIEVLSKSTEGYDRGEKFRKYRSLPSFREYVLINQYQPIVEIFYKADEKLWNFTTIIGLDKNIYLQSIDVTISMSTIYHRINEFEEI